MLSKPDDWVFQPSVMGRELHIERKTMSQYLNRLLKMELVEKHPKYKWQVSYDLVEKLTVS